MNFSRFFAVFKARNIEFFRDRSSLGWNLIFPVLMLVGLSFVFLQLYTYLMNSINTVYYNSIYQN